MIQFDSFHHFQMRETARNFMAKELAPYADQIDKDNGWADQRVKLTHHPILSPIDLTII